jgi:hypothetical protein
MRGFLFTACPVVALAVLEIATPALAGKAPDPAAQRRAVFAWLDGLGYPAVKGLKFVKVATGHPTRNDDGLIENSYLHGLLLQEMDNKFVVLDLRLRRSAFERTPPNTPPHQRVDYEAADVNRFAAAALKQFELEDRGPLVAEGVREQMMRQLMAALSGQRIEGRVMTLSLAWVCHHHGLDDESARFYRRVGGPGDKWLQELVAAELATAEMWQAVLAFQDPAVTRADLKARFEYIVKHLPGTNHHKRAAEAVALLDRMIREDDAHAAARAGGKPFAQLGWKEQARELVFQLRDQPGHQWSQPGACDIFDTLGGTRDTPAHKLVELGYDAVPALIEALDDDRFSRAVGFGRDFYFSHYVLTVGQCAGEILESISGLSLREPVYSRGLQTKDMPEVEKVRAEARAWYAELEVWGEKRWLMDIVRKGNHPALARRLREKYPREALQVLIAGARAARSDYDRHALVREAGLIGGEDALRFLLTEVKEGPVFAGRQAAAVRLQERKRPEGLAAMLAEWGDRKFAREKTEWPWDPEAELAGFLAQSGKPEAVAALAEGLARRPLDVRFAVVEAMRCDPIRVAFKNTNREDPEPSRLRAAVEALLVAALDDTEQGFGWSYSRGGKGISNPHLCDMAADMLRKLDPSRYSYDLEAPWSQRRRDVVSLKNIWRQANKLPPLPFPERKAIARVPEKVLRPLLDRFLNGTDDQRRTAQADIEKLGLGTLPGILRRYNAASGEEAKKRLDDLSKRVACIVAEIAFFDRSLKPDAALRSRLEALRGKPLEWKSFLRALGATLKAMPPGVRGLRVVAERVGDGTGFTLRFDLLDQARAGGKDNGKAPPNWLDCAEHISVGNSAVHGEGGGSQLSIWTDDYNSELASVLIGVLASAPELSIDVSLELIPRASG